MKVLLSGVFFVALGLALIIGGIDLSIKIVGILSSIWGALHLEAVREQLASDRGRYTRKM